MRCHEGELDHDDGHDDGEMPVADGRNIATLVDVADRSHILEMKGYHSARELVERLDAGLREPGER